MWDSIKQWYHDSETILIARVIAFMGAVLGALGSMDYTNMIAYITSGNFNWRSFLMLSAVALFTGPLLEWARKRRAEDL
jgi:hypothetical protein